MAVTNPDNVTNLGQNFSAGKLVSKEDAVPPCLIYIFMQTLFKRLFRRKPTRNITVTLWMLDERDWLAFVTEMPAINGRGPFPASAVQRVERALRVQARRTRSWQRPYVAGIVFEKIALPLFTHPPTYPS